MSRNIAGAIVAELGPVLFILFILLLIPMINLASIGLKSMALFSASRTAAEKAGRANTFTEARQLAIQRVAEVRQSLSGYKINSVEVKILESPKNDPNTIKRKNGPLPLAEADTDANFYQIEVTVTGQVDPFLPGLAGDIPGLSASYPLSCSSKHFVENPGGLVQ